MCLLWQEPLNSGAQMRSQPCSRPTRFGSWDRGGWAAGPLPTRMVDAPALSPLWAKVKCYSPVEGVKPFQKQQNWKKLVQDRSCKKRRDRADVFLPALPQTRSAAGGFLVRPLLLTLPGDNWGSPTLPCFFLASGGPHPTVCKKRD